MPHVDREGTPEHTTDFKSCGCAEAREATLRAECERLKARGIEGMQYRIAELEAALVRIDLLSSQGLHPALIEIGKIAAAALEAK